MTATPEAVELIRAAAIAAADKQATDVIGFDVSDYISITDAFLLCSGANERQVGAIVDAVEDKLRTEYSTKPVRREGGREGRWVLLDFIDVVVHVQHVEERAYYALERLWRDCPTIDLPDEVRAGAPGGSAAADPS